MNQNRHDRLEKLCAKSPQSFCARGKPQHADHRHSRDALRGHEACDYLYHRAPRDWRAAAVEFANRNRTELKDFYKKRVKGALPPDITFEIDMGEKNRLDELSTNSHVAK
jgi:hypothetical protein